MNRAKTIYTTIYLICLMAFTGCTSKLSVKPLGNDQSRIGISIELGNILEETLNTAMAGLNEIEGEQAGKNIFDLPSIKKSIENAGYKAGIYTSASVWKGYPLQRETIQNCGYSIWNAEWSEYSSIDCDIWQFSDKYYVNGINGYVDCSYIYNLNIVN